MEHLDNSKFFANLKNASKAFLVFVLITVGFLLYQKHQDAQLAKAPTIDNEIMVEVASAKLHNVPLYLSALGNVTPQYSVAIKAQVSGILNKIYFNEGQKVYKHQLLAEIDDKPYKAALVQAEGALMRDKSLLENAKKDLLRYQILWKQNSIAKQTLDTQLALVRQYESTVKIDKGNLENAKVNLSYCKIISPIDGQAGLIQIDEGNFIQSSSGNAIVVVNSFDPMTIIFSLPEVELPKVIKQFYKEKNLSVLATDTKDKSLLASGRLYAIDNQIDTNTGTLKFKAIFDNKERNLFPNQFANIKLLVDNLHEVIMVPLAAVQYDQEGSYVFKITTGNIATKVPVELGVTKDDMVLIASGLSVDDKVVIAGSDKITPGATIKISGTDASTMAQSILLDEVEYQDDLPCAS